MFELISVEEVYEKDEKLSKEDIGMLLDWAEKQSHLPKITEPQAICMLQSCYYRMENAKRALDKFFTIRTMYPDIYQVSVTDQVLRVAMDNYACTILPEKSPEGYTIILNVGINTDPDLYNFRSTLTYFDMVYLRHLFRYGPSEGVIYILDMKGGTLGHLAKINFLAAKRYFDYVQVALPIRLKCIHFVNSVSFMDKIMTVIKPFFNKEFTKMFNFYNPEDIESLYEHVPKACLPEDYGGNAPSIQQLHENTLQDILSNSEFFELLNKQKVNEELRTGEMKNDQAMFGITGSFKKLGLD